MTYAQPVELAIQAIASKIGTIAGIIRSDAPPPEAENVVLFAVSYVPHLEIGVAPTGQKRTVFTPYIDLFVPREVNLPKAMDKLTPYLDLIPLTILAEFSITSVAFPNAGGRFGNTMTSIEGKIIVDFINKTDYAAKPVTGYRFNIASCVILVNI